jgi:GntR family carbon starvation induced transcriptional regulator
MTSAGNQQASSDEVPKTLVEHAYRLLRKDIIEGRLLPGERLRVEHLKGQYNVSAGTLREALALLVADALVIVRGQRGAHVTPISLRDIDDITRTRVLLETEALRQSLRAGDDNWEGQLLIAFHHLTRAEERLAANPGAGVDEWEERNRQFHQALISASPSLWIRHFLGILFRQSERYRRLNIAASAVPRNVHAEHKEIFEAALARNEERAIEVLTKHIYTTLDEIHRLPAAFFRDDPTSD